MKAILAVLVFFVISIVTSQPQYPPAVPVAGAEVINLNGPGVVLAYAHNLLMDETDTKDLQTLYFLADKASSNLYNAFFNVQGGEYSFWASDVSCFDKYPVAPFLSFDVLGRNFIGVALPSNQTISARGPIIQSIHNGTTVSIRFTPCSSTTYGYNLVSTFISQTQNAGGNNFVYFAGWDTQSTTIDGAFVVVRGTVRLGSDDPEVTVRWTEDVFRVKMPVPCFDQFGPRLRPHMNMSNNDLILVIPGRCAIFAKITPPVDPATAFSQSTADIFDPSDIIHEYVSSAIYDYKYQLIYYTIKRYHNSSTALYALNVSTTPMQRTDLKYNTGIEQSESILVLGTESINQKDYRWVFVIASGSNKMLRVLFDGKTFENTFYAVLDQTINQIASALYFRPWLFFVTYEPDAKLVRLVKTSFCDVYCKESGYCSQAACVCRPGYKIDPVHPDTGCLTIDLADAEAEEKNSGEATLALGILFGFTLLVAIAGWASWWQRKQRAYTQLSG